MSLARDPWTYISTGMVLAVQWVMTHINVVMGVVMGIGGLVTLAFRIAADRKKGRLLDLEVRHQELENLIKEHELRTLNNKTKEHE